MGDEGRQETQGDRDRDRGSEKGRHRGDREMTTNCGYPSDLILHNPLFRVPFVLKILFVYF